jgi:hypothetical protein
VDGLILAQDEAADADSSTVRGRGANPKQAWFDWDKAVASFVRAEESALDTMTVSLETTWSNMQDLLKQVGDGKYAAFKPLITMEFELCSKRCHFLSLVVAKGDCCDADLAASIDKIKGEQESSSAKGKGKGGRSPPCPSFASCVTMSLLRTLVREYYDAETKADMLAVQKKNRTSRTSEA